MEERGNRQRERAQATLEVPITLKPRPEHEMAMIKHWYNQTPEELFPVTRGGSKRPQGIFTPESRNIRVWTWYFIPRNWRFSQWHFVRLGNRYPSDPNAPTTWQGWKRLENSIAPSTMCDEIRLTRILIQYCNTRDGKVLTELTEWFANMNEIQRTEMAKRIGEHASGTWVHYVCPDIPFILRRKLAYNSNLFVPFRDIYKAIRRYDIAGKSEWNLRCLKALGLIYSSRLRIPRQTFS